MTLTYQQLRDAVAGDFVAIRNKVELQPAGGPGDKVFPSSYGVAQSAEHKYAVETRTDADGNESQTVLLSSVAGEANQHEEALEDRLLLGEIEFPNPYVDFTVDEEIADLGHLSALEAPHRIADAIFRDSMLDGTLFRLSEAGIDITEATPNNATALFLHNPVALLLGMWDSTGPKGGLGSKFQRSLVSEIVGHGAKIGVKVGSRIDPLQIEKGSAEIYQHADPAQRWTLDPNEAEGGSKKPKLMTSKSGEGDAGRPSQINHGNVTPSIDDKAGGATIERAEQTTVLSLASLRKVRFARNADGMPLAGTVKAQAEVAARTVLAALGLAAMVYRYQRDYDLRSRCLLVPTGPMKLEFVPRDGSDPTPIEIGSSEVAQLLSEAADAAASAGLAWGPSLRLEPTPKLVDLIKRSRNAAAEVEGDPT